MKGVHELELLERRGLATLTLAWSARKLSALCSTIEVVLGVVRLTKEKDLYAFIVLELATFDFKISVDFVGYPLCFSLASLSFCSL